MAKHNELGRRGEDLALQTLLKKGYNILERNWKFNGWEIDLIACTKTEIIFVEVKTRSDDSLMNPEETVDFVRQCRLTSAASAYINYHKICLESRFDIIAIVWNPDKCSINHIENAFPPTARKKYY